ncbi:PAS domain S-box protein [Verticiella sediminum]|uniref:PAS domain S-box protein n=1 Tax=Verticiella sediminum TaxID=1247510 RepID=A0A556ARV0_9BURK|nr:methyl-accepting chemotaxis protein [Verticiella sediminum]TSH95657.1 PAS domain S-box protein [Verticiella sediminum]
MRNNQPVIDSEYVVGDDQYLISRTDLQGRIVFANPAFVDVSGFSHDELLGAPHNIVRHPDMPPAAFGDLWETLKTGETWVGMVKNRRKDGRYYWVLATVSPIIADGEVLGYGSVRVKPERQAIEQAQALYARMNAGELRSHRLVQGRLEPNGVRALARRLAFWRARSLGARLGLFAGVSLATIAGVLAMAIYGGQAASVPGWWHTGMAGLGALGGLWVLALAIGLRNSSAQPARQVLAYARQLSAGNLIVSAEGGDTAFGQLEQALETVRKCLLGVAGDMRSSVLEVSRDADRIARGNAELSSRTHQQAAALEETAASMEQFAGSVERSADHANQASQFAHQASAKAAQGRDVVQQAVQRMGAISTSSRKITEIISVIDGIAFQTNILALNAAVEAARAGEQGRGFAVVAGEVRSLAQKSAQAAREIKQLIESSVTEVDAGAGLVQRAGDTMQEVTGAIERVAGLIGEVAASAQEQASGIHQVKSAIFQMDQVTQQNAALVEEVSVASASLRDRSRYLDRSSAVFMLGNAARAAQSAR